MEHCITTIGRLVLLWVLTTSLVAAETSERSLPVGSLQTWTIVVGKEAAPCQRYAAEEFQRFFQQATVSKLPLREPGVPYAP